MNAFMRHKSRAALVLAAWLLSLAGCSDLTHPPLDTVDYVDLSRYMGKWYVVASIPTPLETGAYNAVETYTLRPDGKVATQFSFHDGGFDGPAKTYDSTARVVDTTTNAIWAVQFVWPFESDYRVIDLASDYSVAVVGRQKRDYAWVLSRTPRLPASEYDRATRLLAADGYDVEALRRVPQR